MIGLNGGLLGSRRTPQPNNGPGVWTNNEQALFKRDGTWINDPLFGSVKLLLHMDGANNSTTFTDSSSNAYTVTAGDNAKISTTQSKFGGASGYFDGTNDELSVGTSSAFSFGQGDFCIEAWTYLSADSLSYPIVFEIVHANGNVHLRYGNSGFGYKLQVQITGATINEVWSCATTQTSSLNTWMHLAFTRQSGACRLFKDGALQSVNNGANPTTYPYTSFTDTGSISSATSVKVGKSWNGYIDDLRVTTQARYTSAFTAPNVAFANA